MSSAIEGLLPTLLDAALRGSLILLAALAGTTFMRRSSAASRHLVWLAALSGLLLLPAARQVVPEWRVVPIPQQARVTFTPAPLPSEPIRGSLDGTTSDQPASHPAPRPVDWRQVGFLLWSVGALAVLARLGYGLIRVRLVERRAVEVTDEEWTRLTDTLARRLGLGRIVRVLRGPGATVPMTWGTFSPVILLPGEAEAWDAERRSVVLAHELAHVRRWDALTQWIAHLAVALFWFNPLVWMAARKLREEREHACDDAVLVAGARPVEYADHLLTIVRSLGNRDGTVGALAMARRSQFEGRLLAILDGAVRRSGVTRAAALATLLAGAACVLPLAALQAVEATTAAASEAARAALPRPRTETASTKPSTLAAELTTREPVREVSPPAGNTAPPPSDPRETAPAPASLAGAGERELVDAAGSGDPRLYAEIIRAAEEIRSATGRRMVLVELLRRADLSVENLHGVIAATRTMPSDTERRLVLAEALRHQVMQRAPLPSAFPTVAEAFSSSTELRLVLQAVLERPRQSEGDLAMVIRAAGRIGSPSERRLVLQGAAERHAVTGSAREAYLAVARGLPDLDRGMALTALLGSAPQPESARASAAPSGRDSTWNTDLDIEHNRRRVLIQARAVVYSADRWNIRRIGPGGRLMVEERRADGVICRVEAVPGRDGRPVYTYRRNGEVRPLAEAEGWMAAIVEEFTP